MYKKGIMIAITVLIASIGIFPTIYAEPSISIIMEKTSYSYCEKLFYTIKVSEITGESAIIHIRDEAGKSSSAIPIDITKLENPIPSLVAFEKEIFPLGKYFIDVQYSGAKTTAEFNVIDSKVVCIPGIIKQITINWITGKISDGFLIDAFQKYIEKEIIDIPFEINENNVYELNIPSWVKNTSKWWIEEKISDEDFSKIINYLIDEKIIREPMVKGI